MAETFAARSLRELSRIIFMRSGRMLFIVLSITGLTYFLCWRATPIYRSNVTLLFKQPISKSPVFQESPERALEVFVKAQQQIIMSDLVLARTKVISEDARLRDQWHALWQRLDELRHHRTSPSEPFDAKGAKEIKDAHAAVISFLNDESGPVVKKVKSLMNTRQRDLLDFRDDVKLQTPGGEQVAMTESFQIQVDRPAPLEQQNGHLNAMYAADVLADMYMVRFREFQEALSGAAGEFMKHVVDEHNQVLVKTMQRLDEFITTELDSPGDVAILEQLLKSGTEHGYQIIATRAREATLRLSDDLSKAKSIRALLRKQLPPAVFEQDASNKLPADVVARSVEVIPPEILETSIVINRMTQNVLRVKAKLANLATQFTPANAALRNANEELDRSNRFVLAELVAYAKSLDVTIDSLQERIKGNQSNLKSVETRLDKINRKLTEYQRLKNDVTVAEKEHQDLQEQQVTAFTADERARAAVTIDKLDSASRPAPDKPTQPLTMIYTIIAAAVGALLATAYAFLADHFDHTFRTIDEAERYLGVPVIGSVSKRGRTILPSA